MLEAVPDALVGMDQKGVIQFVNRQSESLFGFDRDSLIGQPIEIIVPEPLWQIYAQNRDQYFADPITRSSGLEVELTGRRQDGREFPVNISISHIDTGDVLLVITAVADVTRREAAVENARLIAAVVEYSNDALMSGTLEGIVTSWNPAAERMYGYSSKEMIGRSANILSPEDRAGELAANLATVRAGQPVENLQTERVRRDGSLVPVSLTLAPIHDEDGTIVGMSVIHRDVTEQRLAFEASQRMAAIVEGSEDAIFSSTLTGTITSWNRSAEQLFGYTSVEIIGKSGRLLSPKNRTEEIRTILASVRAGKHVERLETVRVRKDGTTLPVSLTVSPISDSDGAVIGASAISRDLTEQRESFENTQRIAAIVESSGDAIIGASLDGLITSWNPAAEKMFGYSGEEIIGRPVSVLSPQDQAAEQRAVLGRITATGVAQHLESTRVHADGTVFPVSLVVSPIHGQDGTVVGISATVRDLTEKQHSALYARSLIEAALDPMLTISPEGKINDVNEATAKVTGVPRQEIIGTDFTGYFTEPDKAAQGYHQVLEQGSVTDYPLTIRHRDGTLTDVSYNASVYRDLDGTVLGIFAAARDITERK
jgi:PAS domain S-box-containing protein